MFKKFRVRDVEGGRTVADFFSAKLLYDFWVKYHLKGFDHWRIQYFDQGTRTWELLSFEDLETWAKRNWRRKVRKK